MNILISALILCSLVSLLLPKKYSTTTPFLVSLVLGTASIFFFSISSDINEAPLQYHLTWSQFFGVDLALVVDGLSLVFALLICGIGTGVFAYTAAYMKKYEDLRGFYACLTIFTAAMLLLIASDNILLFFIAWEVTSLCSFLLVGFNKSSKAAGLAARKALFITVGGGLFLLCGIALLSIAGIEQGLTLQESLLFSKLTPAIQNSPYYPFILCCFVTAIATKSAQFPFSIWLPAAMAGPTPVSSFLHSATMVKAGIFLLFRIYPSFSGTILWQSLLIGIGLTTLILSVLQAISQSDIKKILAYSTISVLGILVLLIGLSNVLAVKAAIVFMVAHGLYKATLFQIAGNIDYATGSRNIKTLANLARFMPMTALAALLSALSMAGSPPLFGFFGKELAYAAKLSFGTPGILLLVLAILANSVLVGIAISIFYRPFWVRPVENCYNFKKPPFLMSLIPLCFSLMGLTIGLYPDIFDDSIGSLSAAAVEGVDIKMELKLWHGIDVKSILILVASVVTLGLGFYIARSIVEIISRAKHISKRFKKLSLDQAFDRIMISLTNFANRMTKLIQKENLNYYIRLSLSAVAAIMIGLVMPNPLDFDWNFSPTLWLGALFFLVISYFLYSATSKRFAIVILALIGTFLVSFFALYGAIDLAMTQFMVEAMTLLTLVTLINPGAKAEKTGPELATTNSLNTLLIFIISYAIVSPIVQNGSTVVTNDLNRYLNLNALVKAFGSNVTNVILVDFRAIDTFGEIIVIAIAAIGGGLLLECKNISTSKTAPNPLTDFSLRLLAFCLLGYSLFILLRGHNLPGGGFIGGLILGLFVFFMRVKLAGSKKSFLQLPLNSYVLLLAFLILVPIVPTVFGRIAFSALWSNISLPLAGKFSSVLVFDTLIYLIVAMSASYLLESFYRYAEAKK